MSQNNLLEHVRKLNERDFAPALASDGRIVVSPSSILE
jgi:hypothetical protein